MWNRLRKFFRGQQQQTSKFAQPQPEPLFTAIPKDDPEILAAHALAAKSIEHFVDVVRNTAGRGCSAKLRFRDPDESERLGEDRFLYLWLTSVVYHPDEKLLSGIFFEVPEPFTKWHQVGQRLGFEPDDVFDWMILEDGHLHGGFTLRVTRKHLPAGEREAYDRYIGVSVYEPQPS